MAGRARTNAILDSLEKRRRDHFEDDSDSTTLDYLCEWIANGHTLKALAQELTDELHFEVWAESLHRIIRRQFGDDRADKALTEARARASHGFAEEALELVDRADDTSSAAVSKASSQARSRQWLASKWNRKDYGDDKGVSVNVSISSLHLDALRSRHMEVTGSAKITSNNTPSVGAESTQVLLASTVSQSDA